MKTLIFETYSDFLNREDVELNGVSKEFAELHPDFEKQNITNEGCWNSSGCSGCSDCSDCSRCSDCSDLNNAAPVEQAQGNAFPEIPIIENIHQRILEAVSAPDHALNMGHWHICDTTHCRAGWVTFMAGEAGKKLEEATSTAFAAMQIYHKSSPIRVSPVRFYEDNEKAMEDIKRCADLENQAVYDLLLFKDKNLKYVIRCNHKTPLPRL
jgi:hypothetical protein